MIDNKIKIPWYRRNIRITQHNENEIAPLNIDFRNIPKPSTVVPDVEMSPVPEPSPVIVPEPLPVQLPSTPPLTAPELNPFPVPMPRPWEEIEIPTAPTFDEKQRGWVRDFVTRVKLVANITGKSAKEIYDFLNEYDYKNLTVPQFNQDVKREYGLVGGTILTVLIVGKQLVSLWGRRVTIMFNPPVKLDDTFFQEYFDRKDI